MYNGGFGAYPQDDMGVNSYFGESDTNFFDDTSNDSFFAEGSSFDNGFSNNEMITESMGFSTDGGEFFTEAKGTPSYTDPNTSPMGSQEPIMTYPDTTKDAARNKAKTPGSSQRIPPREKKSPSGQWWTQHEIPNPTQPAGKSKGHNSYDTNEEAFDKNIEDAWDMYPDKDSFMKARASRVASMRKYRDDQWEEAHSSPSPAKRRIASLNSDAARGWMSTGSYLNDDAVKKAKDSASKNFNK